MGTKGYYAIRYGDILYQIYNQCDSQPDHLGMDLLNELKRISYEEWVEMFENCVIIDSEEDYEKHIDGNDELKVRLLKHHEGGLARYGGGCKKIDYEEEAKRISYNGFYGIYKYALSLERVLTSGYIFTNEPMYDIEYGYMYDIEYGYILDLDQKRFIFEDVNKEMVCSYSIYQLPEKLYHF